MKRTVLLPKNVARALQQCVLVKDFHGTFVADGNIGEVKLLEEFGIVRYEAPHRGARPYLTKMGKLMIELNPLKAKEVIDETVSKSPIPSDTTGVMKSS